MTMNAFLVNAGNRSSDKIIVEYEKNEEVHSIEIDQGQVLDLDSMVEDGTDTIRLRFEHDLDDEWVGDMRVYVVNTDLEQEEQSLTLNSETIQKYIESMQTTISTLQGLQRRLGALETS